MKFMVKHFDDYHDILHYDGEYNAIELGCFPVREYGYCRYFGLFYKGRKPLIRKVLDSVLRKVTLRKLGHYRSGEDISYSRNEVLTEILRSMKD
jgi:hypothetical protein